jgi:PQQ-dependent dehydrogenase (methanol/ethanol family)
MKDVEQHKFDLTNGLESGLEQLDDQHVEATEVELNEEAPGEDVTDEMILEDAMNPEGWLLSNKGLEQHGYNSADRITTDNVADLTREYTITDYKGLQNQPVVVPGDPPVMYWVNAVPQKVQAINARNGEAYWTLTYQNENMAGLTHANRGVAVRGDKVYLGSHDNHIVAINRYNGEIQWKTKTLTARQKNEMVIPDRLANTQAPVAYDGKVFKGQTGFYGGWAASFGVDAESGDILWDETTIPESQWIGDSWRHGDAAPWNLAAIDHESGLLFRPTGNPAPMFNSIVRPGPNRDSQSVVAFDIDSGDVKWRTQLVAHDWHDYDTYNTRVIEMEVNGEQQRVVQAINKTGWMYFLDIETGKIIERSEPYAQQGGEVPFMSWLPHGEENTKSVFPSDRGATEWTPDAFSPDTGYVYIGGNDHGREYAWIDYEYDEDAAVPQTGGANKKLDPDQQHMISSFMAALDPATGEVVWKHEYEVHETDSGFARAGGTTVTGGNVAFGGSANGELVAVNAENGEFLWQDNISDKFRGITAAPVTWDDPAAGKQYVAIASQDGIAVYGLEA